MSRGDVRAQGGSGGTRKAAKCPRLCQACALGDSLPFPAWVLGHWDPVAGDRFHVNKPWNPLLEAGAVSQRGPL